MTDDCGFALMKNNINNPKFHPACLLFPRLPDEELQSLADDIEQNGLSDAIVTLNGEILDGRNRLEACKIAGVVPNFVEWDGDGSPLAWVISKNLMRRHLTASQRAVVAFGLLPLLEAEAKERQRLSKGRGKKGAQPCATSTGKASEQAARIANSSARTVELVKAIHKQAPELIEEIRTGTLSVSEATELSKLPKDQRKTGKPRPFMKLQNDDTDTNHEPQSEYSTPDWLFNFLDDEFHFTLDAAALPENAKCDRFFTPTTDGLSQSWSGETVWCNPPFHRFLIGDWVKKAFDESRNGTITVMLIPSRYKDYRWWKDFCIHFQVRFLHDYIRFPRCDDKEKSAYVDVTVVVFGPDIVPGSAGPPIIKAKVETASTDEVSNLVSDQPPAAPANTSDPSVDPTHPSHLDAPPTVA